MYTFKEIYEIWVLHFIGDTWIINPYRDSKSLCRMYNLKVAIKNFNLRGRRTGWFLIAQAMADWGLKKKLLYRIVTDKGGISFSVQLVPEKKQESSALLRILYMFLKCIHTEAVWLYFF